MVKLTRYFKEQITAVCEVCTVINYISSKAIVYA